MDHSYATRHLLADRYLLGQLSADEARRFEHHYLGCEACQQDLEDSDGLRRGLRQAMGRDPLAGHAAPVTQPPATQKEAPPTPTETAPPGTRTTWSHLRPHLAWAAALALCATLGSVPSVRDLWTRPDAASSQLASSQLPASGNVPLLFLSPQRGEAHPATLILPPEATPVVVSLDLGVVEFDRYRAHLHAQPDAPATWSLEDLRPDGRALVTLVFSPADLQPGTAAVIRVEGRTAAGRWIETGRYQFRVQSSHEAIQR